MKSAKKFSDVFQQMLAERAHQIAKHGDKDHPDGVNQNLIPALMHIQELVGVRQEIGAVSWVEILAEEFLEVATEPDPVKLKAELVQVATVCAAWIHWLERRDKHRFNKKNACGNGVVE